MNADKHIEALPTVDLAERTGALSSFEGTVLMTVDETLAALRKAEQVRYRAPGA
jgi:hypothetical protein